jgi:tetrahydromethanopterin S-methyltransferase subunit G
MEILKYIKNNFEYKSIYQRLNELETRVEILESTNAYLTSKVYKLESRRYELADALYGAFCGINLSMNIQNSEPERVKQIILDMF